MLGLLGLWAGGAGGGRFRLIGRSDAGRLSVSATQRPNGAPIAFSVGPGGRRFKPCAVPR